MRRDMDLIRELLLKIEGGQTAFEILGDEGAPFLGEEGGELSQIDADRLESHLDMLESAGFIEVEMRGTGIYLVRRITWAGHDFLDTVREPQVWSETKSRAQKIGSWTVGLLADIGKGYAKAKAAELGIPMS